jgi:hypothetical protein
MNSVIKKITIGAAFFCMVMFAGGCSFSTDGKAAKVRDLEYTVVGGREIPEELSEEIEANKNTEFKLTYSDGEYLYIARGYGGQETDGYSIQMKELYVTDDAVYMQSELFGPQNGETVSQVETFPYVVVKTEFVDLPVLYE